MKVLFVSSGNSRFGISPIVTNQQISLINEGLEVEIFPIIGMGIVGYLKNSFRLKKYLENRHYDIIHAHYSLSGFTATLANSKPLVVSLMGSDTKSGLLQHILIRVINKIFWATCIVKSKRMRNDIGISKAVILPNGVDFNCFYPIPRKEAIKKLKFNPDNKYIFFASDPNRSEKNYKLANDAIELLNRKNIVVHFLKDIPNDEVVWYYCASDIVLLTSLREGSPNVIKEAMACNRPIVATDVGDVKEIIGNVEGCYICDFSAENLANKINSALLFKGQTNGREQINHLRSELIAKRLIEIYGQTK